MTAALGLSKYQEIALNNHLSVGGTKNNGLLINAALHNGFHTNFQGCYMSEVVSATPGPVYSRIGVDLTYNPYMVNGVSQLMHIDGSDTNVVAAAGFPNAAAASDTGVLRLTCNDTNTTALVMAMWQNNALWLATGTSFTLVYDIAQWSERQELLTESFSEIGVCGTCRLTEVLLAASVPGTDNATLNPFITVKFYANRARLVLRPVTAAAVQTSESFEVPAGKFTIRMEYVVPANGGVPSVTVYVNDRNVTSINATITGPLQLFARNCHNTGYLSATMAPAIFDIDAIVVAPV